MRYDSQPYEDPIDQMTLAEHDRAMRDLADEIDDGRWDDFLEMWSAIEDDQEYQAEWDAA